MHIYVDGWMDGYMYMRKNHGDLKVRSRLNVQWLNMPCMIMTVFERDSNVTRSRNN